MWAARDEDKTLKLFTHEPLKIISSGVWVSVTGSFVLFKKIASWIRVPFFKELTWESDPWEFDFVRKGDENE